MNSNKEFPLTQLYNVDLFSKVNYFVAQQRWRAQCLLLQLEIQAQPKEGFTENVLHLKHYKFLSI